MIGHTQPRRIAARARAGRLTLVDDGAALIDTTYVDNAADAIAQATRAFRGYLAALEPRAAVDLVVPAWDEGRFGDAPGWTLWKMDW